MSRTGLTAWITLAACGWATAMPGQPAGPAGAADHRQEIRAWQERRAQGLRNQDSWLTLVGLFWLRAGENSFGSGAGSALRLEHDQLPARAGSFWREENRVRFEAAPKVRVLHDGAPVQSIALEPDSSAAPTELELGSLSFHVIERAGEYGVRVKDRRSAALQSFQGLSYFPIDDAWRVTARFEPYDPVKKVPILNVTGQRQELDSPGALVFEIAGQSYRLDPLGGEDGVLFIMFADGTSGKETYGAGRYLYVPVAENGTTVVDFNKAQNPPCAFTRFATCPLPPPQNRLPIRVTAGEKSYAGAGH